MTPTPKTPLTLYHYWRSSCSWRVRWALAIKGVSYDSVPVNILTGEHRTPEHLRRNPAGALPVLEMGGQTYAESLALIEWIDETWPEPALWPRDPLLRLHARQLALTIVSGTQPLQNPSLLKYFQEDEAKRQEAARHWIARGLKTYETLLERGPKGAFSCGDQITAADLCLIPQVYNAKRFEVPLTETPRVAAIYEKARATRECKIAEPEQQPGAH
jgi:maleylacetoacetate isomerase